MARDTQDPRQQVKIRFFREVGVQRWQVFEIAAALPLLLQLALLLFFVGLSAFLHDLNPVVTWVVTGVMIIWLSFYLFTTFAPAFSSQCPYKTPMLKGLLQRIRVGSHTWLEALARTLHTNIPNTWLTIKQRCGNLRDLVKTWSDACVSREETRVRNGAAWDIPTLACSQEILRGEQLEETITDCFRKFHVASAFNYITLNLRKKHPVIPGILPDLPRGLTRQTCELIASHIGDLPLNFNEQWSLQWTLKELHDAMTYVSLEIYNYNLDTFGGPPILELSLPLHIRLINEGPDPALYSILTMDFIRRRTMEDHLEHFKPLFKDLLVTEDEKKAYGIGARFIPNLVAATRDICHRVRTYFGIESWDGVDLDDLDFSGISYWIRDIQTDQIPLISTFVKVLCSLIPRDVIQEHRAIIFEVMDDLANILTVTDGSSWSRSRQEYVELTYQCLTCRYLVDTQLIPKLQDVIRSWKPGFGQTRPWWDH
ncbi:hypothetical protein QCA50_019582 [Cerrena zonata]|uniref:DUF6535 domain-containing protein n=1 Tax=Cerrena zonata TaxID=2478898 RepID=A0AAW0FH29_9APHY